MFCKEERALSDIHIFLQDEGMEAIDGGDLIEQLVELQLLITDGHPNSIGEDYFTRLSIKVRRSQPLYRLSERNRIVGELAEKDVEVLLELAELMGERLPFSESKELLNFKENFIKRYEYSRVSLLKVLDPEQGIGYGSFEGEIDQDNLIEQLTKLSYSGQGQIPSYQYTDLNAFIINKIFLNQPIRLEQFEPQVESKMNNLPNTFSALVELIDNNLLLKSMGGVTATSLLGRFTLTSDEVLKEAKTMVAAEEKANPGILFFDISYQGEKEVDNINRRASIYSYELPVLSWSDNQQSIHLSEVVVTVQGDEIILFSTKYKKRMIPRLASAYNYVRSDLSVFRFLTDLQHQNVQSNLFLELSSLFPNLDYYPRICFKNVIINPARWLMPKLSFSVSTLSAWLESKGIIYFKTTEGDQTLLYSLEKEEDLRAFLMYIKGKNRVYIEEAFLPKKAIIQDEKGKEYLSELIVNFVNPHNHYQAYSFEEKDDDNLNVQPSFLPGDEWLYYEIYCHHIRSNEILLGLIEPFISENATQIEKWFFIRYFDPDNHIRFRMKLKEEDGAPVLMALFNEELKPWIALKYIKEVQLKTYYREIERYGSKKIAAIEGWFQQDSNLVLSILSENRTNLELYSFSVEKLKKILDRVMPDLNDQLSFVRRMAESFILEHRVSKVGFKIINEGYRQFVSINKGANKQEELHLLCMEWESALEDLFESCGDLIHMHINRLFHKDQRMHEMIMYEFLFKQIKERQKKEESDCVSKD